MSFLSAAIFGIQDPKTKGGLGLHGQEYSILSSSFYIGTYRPSSLVLRTLAASDLTVSTRLAGMGTPVQLRHAEKRKGWNLSV